MARTHKRPLLRRGLTVVVACLAAAPLLQRSLPSVPTWRTSGPAKSVRASSLIRQLGTPGWSGPPEPLSGAAALRQISGRQGPAVDNRPPPKDRTTGDGQPPRATQRRDQLPTTQAPDLSPRPHGDKESHDSAT